MNAFDLRGQNIKYSDEEKAKVAKRAFEMGITNSLQFFKKEFSDRPLKESTVHTWENKYEQEIKLRHKLGKPTDLKKLESARRGHPLLLGAVLDKEVQEYMKNLREGIVKNHDSNLLQCNGGHVIITKSWVKSFLDCMGYVNQRASTKVKVNPADFEAQKNKFVLNVKTVVLMEEIQTEIILECSTCQ